MLLRETRNHGPRGLTQGFLTCLGLVSLAACGGGQSTAAPGSTTPALSATSRVPNVVAASDSSQPAAKTMAVPFAANPGALPSGIQLRIHEFEPIYQPDDASWCWAAASEMVTSYVNGGNGIKMCEHAEKVHGTKPCCTEKHTPPCSDRAWPDLEAFFYAAKPSDGPWPLWNEVKQELDIRPYMVSEYRDGAGGKKVGHMVVVRGYAVVENENFVVTVESDNGVHAWHRYEDYRVGEGLFTPGPYYYQVRPPGAPPEVSTAPPGETPPSGPSKFTGLSAQQATNKGLELIRTLATVRPKLFGLAPDEDPKYINLDCKDDLEVLERNPQAQSENQALGFCFRSNPRGVIWLHGSAESWSLVQVSTNTQRIRESIAAARLYLHWRKLTPDALVFHPGLAEYFFRVKKRYLPLRKLGNDLEPWQLYDLKALKRGLAPLLRPSPTFKPPGVTPGPSPP